MSRSSRVLIGADISRLRSRWRRLRRRRLESIRSAAADSRRSMSAEGADWLDRAERETEEEPDEALDIIGIKKGSTVADIGAGSGYMTIRMARRVGDQRRRLRQRHPAADARSARPAPEKGKIANVRADPRHTGRSEAAGRVARDGADGGRVPRVLPAAGDAAAPARGAEDRRTAGAARVPQGGSLRFRFARNTR